MDNKVLMVDFKSEDELLRIALAGYKNSAADKIRDQLLVINPALVSNEDVTVFMKRMRNLTGPKTLEGRRKALANLQNGRKKTKKKKLDPEHPEQFFLDDRNEIALYEYKKGQYFHDFNLNQSSDHTLLHQILMLEVQIFRLRQQETRYIELKKESPTMKLVDPSVRISKVLADLDKLIKSLAADRKGRGDNTDRRDFNIATAADNLQQKQERIETTRMQEIREAKSNYVDAQEDRDEELKNMGVLGHGYKPKDHTSKG